METTIAERMSDEIISQSDAGEFNCDSCENDGQTVTASGFCLECSEYLCNGCIKHHRKLNVLKNHMIKEGKDMPQYQNTERELKQILVDICQDHVDRFIEYYCQSCDKLCCNVCVHSGHRKCEKVDFIPDLVKDAASNTEENEFVKKTAKLNDGYQTQTGIIEKKSKASTEWSDNALSAIREQKRKIIEHFDNLEKQIELDVNTYSSENKANMEKASVRCKDIKTRLDVLTTKAREREGPRQAVQRYIQVKRSRDELAKLESDFSKLEKDKLVTRKLYIPSLEATEVLTKVQQLGRLEVRDPDIPRETKFDRDISIVTSGQTNRVITTITILSDTRLLAVAKFPGIVQLINPQTSRVNQCLQSKHSPHEMTRISNNQAIATFPGEGKLKYIDLTSDDKLKYGQEIDVGKGCQGIAYTGDKFVVSFKDMTENNGPGKVKIVDMTGKHLQNISTDQSGNALFQDPIYLKLNNDQTLMYIADKELKKVLCLSMNGDVLNTFGYYIWSRYIAVSAFDSVFLCTLTQIDQVLPGSSTTTPVTDRFECNYSVACWGDTMYVGTDQGVIKVYTIV